MAEIKFSCPQCNQKISCDELWGGHQLQCPSCQREVTVPQNQAAPAPAPVPGPQMRVSFQPRGSAAPGPPPPPPSAQPKLSLGRPQHGQPSESGEEPPAKAKPVYREFKATVDKKGRARQWVATGALIVVLGVGGYFGYQWYAKRQEQADAQPPQANSNAGDRKSPAPSGVARPIPGPASEAGGDPAKPAEKELPVIPAVWTLDIGTAKIPEGRANGRISGTNFVVESASLGIVGNAHVLSLRQGAAASPDREILIYLHPKAGQSLTGQVLTVSKDMKGAGVPQVAKRWKPNPKFAPQRQAFSSGYAMKLEFGASGEGEIPGRIFIALPDPEQSVVAGVFKAATTLANVASPTANPATPAPTQVRPLDPEFQKRYGVKR